ncbi:MAG: hypothetical protein FWE21_04835 [Defluviitaleaceae bacterium]|nr:hypothetical protein [Defluviitaleaceae bacterium]
MIENGIGIKSIGLSLDSIKNVIESELSEKILTILLDEQVKIMLVWGLQQLWGCRLWCYL